MTGAAAIARMLAERVDQLVADLLPGGHREGQEWRCGSVAGEPGNSLGVHLTGVKRGLWADFAGGGSGDALDLVRAVLGLNMLDALIWSHRWLGIEVGEAAVPRQPAQPANPEIIEKLDPMRWCRPWSTARPIAGTPAEIYLAVARGLRFADPEGRVLRYLARRARKGPTGDLEHRPAMLAALCDVRTGEQVGIVNVFLRPDGTDRLRDSKGKIVTGRAKGAAVMLSAFDEPTYGLTICEGLETGIALMDLAPVWALGGAVFLASFPVLGGIEALTIAADADDPGRRAAASVAARWRDAGREVAIIAPPAGDWAEPRKDRA